MITSYHGGNTSLSNFPFRAPFRTPRCLGWGGELVKEVDFVFMFCYYFVQAHFVMFSGLLGPFLQPNFLWLCLTRGLKN